MNYVVAENADIFEYVKRDILLQMAKADLLTVKNSKSRRPAISEKVNHDAVAIRFRYGALEALHSMMGLAYCPLGTLTSSVSTQKLSERWLQPVQRGVI